MENKDESTKDKAKINKGLIKTIKKEKQKALSTNQIITKNEQDNH